MSASTKKKLRKEQNAEIMTERQKKERAEAKKTKTATIVFVVAIALVLCVFIGVVGSTLFTNYGVVERLTTAATVGNHKINSIMMNYFFYDAVNNEYSNIQQTYGDYASYFLGYDPSLPLDEQKYDESGMTWADHYMDVAIENAHTIYAVYDHAMDNGFEITDEVQQIIDSNLMQVQFQAMFSNTSANTLLRAIYGNGANERTYEKYVTVKVVASSYYQEHQESLSYDAAAIDTYEAEHFNEYSSYDFYSYQIKCDDYLTGGTTDSEGKTTYSAEDKEAARAAAEAAANTLLTATNHEELDAAIAALHAAKKEQAEATEPEATEPEATEPEATEAEDEESEPEATEAEKIPTAEHNSDVNHTTLLADYAEWLGASDRVAGNIKVFPNKTTAEDGTETVTGYYVLMFQSRDDKTDLMANLRQILITPEGGKTENGTTTYSDAEWAAAKEKAEKLLEQWKAGAADEDSFIALVAENSKDTATSENGGLYEDIHEDYTGLATDLVKWALDDSRAEKDTAVIKSSTGYHVVYFVGDDEMNYRDYMITQDLINNDMTAWHDGIVDAVTVKEGNDSRINKSLVLAPKS